jgi:hypothetical protein
MLFLLTSLGDMATQSMRQRGMSCHGRHSVLLKKTYPRKPTWGGTGNLIATLPTELLGLAGSGAVVDEPITLALGTDPHRYTPSQRWAYLARGGSITGGGI